MKQAVFDPLLVLPAIERNLVILTVSYAGDLERFSNLAQSLRKHVPELLHIAVVPAVDIPLFQGQDPNLIVLAVESVLPGYRHLRVGKRDLWRTPGRLRPISGWYVQQIVKLKVVSLLRGEACLILDSDIEILRGFSLKDFSTSGKLTYLRYQLSEVKPFHVQWRKSTQFLLGCELAADSNVNYVEAGVILLPRVVRSLLSRVDSLHGPWESALISQSMFSEFFLYGAFIENFWNQQKEGLRILPSDIKPVYSLLYEPGSAAEIDAFIDRMPPSAIGFCIQSNMHWPLEIIESVSDRVRNRVSR